MIKFLYGSGNADIRYKTGFDGRNPVFFVDNGKNKYLFLDDLEYGTYDNVGRKAFGVRAMRLDPYIDSAKENHDDAALRCKIAFAVLKSSIIRKNKVLISKDLPVDMADYLRRKKIDIRHVGEMYPDRVTKSAREIKIIKGIIGRIKIAFKKIEFILNNSTIKKHQIFYKGKILTSEVLKKEIDQIFIDHGLKRKTESIVSCGVHSAIPHHCGKGPLKPGLPIVADLFPRDERTGYFGDMTRTYVKGEPSEKLKKMFKAVSQARDNAMKKIKAGVSAKEIHEECADTLRCHGFDTKDGQGFIHAAGHGLGLDLHEKPHVGPSSGHLLEEGNVVTIEPGLYYRGIGGVRIEDVVLVTKSGCENLTNYPCKFIQ